jgi:hypothetical protein
VETKREKDSLGNLNAAEPQTRNPNVEIRNKSEIRRKKIKMEVSASYLISAFEIRICFGFRISILEFISAGCIDLRLEETKEVDRALPA